MTATGGRPGLSPLQRRGPLSSLASIIAAMAIIASCGGVPPSAPPDGSSAAPSSAATPSAAPAATGSTAPAPIASPDPSAPPEAWTAVTVASVARPAELVPTKAGAGSVARDTAFVLTSLTGAPAAELATRLVTSPEIRFKVSASGTKATLTPASGLAPSTRYRISLVRTDGTTEASWSATTAGPLAITATIPGVNATGVPLDAGVEVTFNQSGVTVAEFKRHITITPATPGTFSAAGRAIAFTPANPLKKATLYTVKIDRGLTVDGTGETLAADVVLQFETAGSAQSPVQVWFNSALVDANTRERPAFGLDASVPDGAEMPTTLQVTVSRLANMPAAMSAWRAVEAAPEWTQVSASEAVATARLPRVLSAKVTIRQIENGEGLWFALPESLPSGWYLVTERFGGIPRQTVLQVTDVAVYSLVTTTRTALWVNDIGTGGAVAGATATLDGEPLAGATDGRGLLVAATPRSVASGAVARPLVVVSAAGRLSFHDVRQAGLCGKCDIGPGPAALTRPWWSAVSTDRYQYRSSDTVNAYGIVRLRADDSVPSAVTVGIWTDAGSSTGTVPIATVSATPDVRGMYAAHLRLSDLPSGSYRLIVRAGTDRVAETWFMVASLRKPAYGLSVTTDHGAYIVGSTVAATVTAGFFEGTPVAGASLKLAEGDDTSGSSASVTTDIHGTATGTLVATLGTRDQWTLSSVRASAIAPEEADITAEHGVAVFSGEDYITTAGKATPKTVLLTGAVNAVVLSRYDSAAADPWLIDPRGAPRPNRTVSVTGTAYVETLVRTGSAYDFVTKRVVPTYRVKQTTVALPPGSVQTRADGSFSLSVRPVASAVSYDFIVSVLDRAGRRITTDRWVSVESGVRPAGDPWLVNADGVEADNSYAVGAAVRVRFQGGSAQPTAERYLYAVLQEGLSYATVGTSSIFRTTFTAASVPSISILAARFNGTGYDVVSYGYQAATRLADHAIGVSLRRDKDRYEPGDTAKVTIRTTGPEGQPTAASVFVQAVDEKLRAIGAMRTDDLLPTLYSPLDSGLLGIAASHRTPRQLHGGGGGDTTGGGGDSGRTDFRDWLVAQVVTTDARGEATISIPLSDDLTSWRVTGTAVDAARNEGSGDVLLPVGLPFFADAIIAPEYLAIDRPSIAVRSFGSALAASDDVTFTVSSDTLPMPATTLVAKGFASATVNLPALSVGTHRVRITATTGTGADRQIDSLTRTFRVVGSRATGTRMTWSLLEGTTPVQAGKTLTTLTLADAGRGRVIPLLQELAVPDGTRADRVLAWSVARGTLADSFHLSSAPELPAGLLSSFWQGNGVSVVPWGSADLDVTVLAAMARDPQLNGAWLAQALREVAFSATETRPRRLLALAGLAAAGEPVLGDVRSAAAQPDLTPDEQVDIALAAWFAGDETLAATFERNVLAACGRTFAGQVRIDAGTGVDATVATARLAIVAASLGDPLAAGMDAWVASHPSAATIVDLERALAARGWADRVPGTTSAVSVSVDGQTQTLTLDPGQPVQLTLTPAQAATARLTPTAGSVLAVQQWEAPLDTARLDRSGGLSLTRSSEPSGTIDALRTVVVTMKVNLGTSSAREGWRVVDLAPSGLLPLSGAAGGAAMDDPGTGTRYECPSRVDGQRVEFSIGWDPERTVYTLRYLARVVTAGSYTWEPAVLQSIADPSAGDATPWTTVTITSAPG